MLTSVAGMLRELGLVSAQARLSHSINLTTGECIALSLYDGRRFFQVKVSEFISLKREFERCVRASERFGRFVPRPLGYGERDGWSMLVLEGIKHTNIQASVLLRSARDDTSLSRDLCEFFEFAGSYRVESDSSIDSPRDPQWWIEQFRHTNYEQLAMTWVEHGVRCGMFDLPVRSQHGDFVLNNLAWTGKNLVIFDWEDFGKIGSPGLDLATLLTSLSQENVKFLHQFFAYANPELGTAGELIRRACSSYGMDFDQFRTLLPVYLLMFAHLKQYYGRHVQRRVCSFLQLLSHEALRGLPVTTSKHGSGPRSLITSPQ